MNPLHYEISNLIEPVEGLPDVDNFRECTLSPCGAWIVGIRGNFTHWKEWHPVNWYAWENAGRLLEMMVAAGCFVELSRGLVAVRDEKEKLIVTGETLQEAFKAWRLR